MSSTAIDNKVRNIFFVYYKSIAMAGHVLSRSHIFCRKTVFVKGVEVENDEVDTVDTVNFGKSVKNHCQNIFSSLQLLIDRFDRKDYVHKCKIEIILVNSYQKVCRVLSRIISFI